MNVQKRHLLLLQLGEFLLHPGDLGKSLARSLGTASTSALSRKKRGIWVAELLDIVEQEGQKQKRAKLESRHPDPPAGRRHSMETSSSRRGLLTSDPGRDHLNPISKPPLDSTQTWIPAWGSRGWQILRDSVDPDRDFLLP